MPDDPVDWHFMFELRSQGTLKAPDGTSDLVAVSTTADGLLTLWQDQTDRPAVLAGYLDDTSPAFVIELEAKVPDPCLDVLPDGSFVVVGRRCAWRGGDPERNAYVFDRDGKTIATGCLGDGIQQVHVDGSTIWVSYFDEGVFGNRGWGGPGPEPLGAPGIVAWSTGWERLWRADADIYDCYALTSAAGTIWAATYPEFPLRRIRNGRMTTIQPTGAMGPAALVVAPGRRDGDLVGLISSYDHPWELTLGRVVGKRFQIIERTNLKAPASWTLVTNRGPRADFFVGTHWFSFTLN